MRYKIKIEVQKPIDTDDAYDRYETIFEQIIEDAPVAEIIKATNNFA